MLQMFLTLITHSLAEAKKDERMSDQLKMEEYIYRKIASMIQNLKHKLTQSREEREQEERERQTNESLRQTDQDIAAIFAYKADQLLSKYNEFQFLSARNERIQRFIFYSIIRFNIIP